MRKNRFLQFFILFAVAVGIFSFVGMTDVKAATTKVKVTVEAHADAAKGADVKCSSGNQKITTYGSFEVDRYSWVTIKVTAKSGYALTHRLQGGCVCKTEKCDCQKEWYEESFQVQEDDVVIEVYAYSLYTGSGTPSSTPSGNSSVISVKTSPKDVCTICSLPGYTGRTFEVFYGNNRKTRVIDEKVYNWCRARGISNLASMPESNFHSWVELAWKNVYGPTSWSNLLSTLRSNIASGSTSTPYPTLGSTSTSYPTSTPTPSPSKAPNRGYAERVKLLEGSILDYFYEKGLWKTLSSMSNEEFDSWLKKAQAATAAMNDTTNRNRFIPPTDAPTFSGFLGGNNPYAMTTFYPNLMPTWPQKITVQVYGYSDRDLRETYEIYMPKNYVYQIPVFTEPADFLPVRPKEIYDSRGSWSTSEGLFTTVGGPITLKYRRCEIDHNQTLTKEYGDYYAKVSYRENGNVVTKKMKARRGTDGRIEILEFLEK